MSRELAPSSPLSFCQSFCRLFLQAAESCVFKSSRLRSKMKRPRPDKFTLTQPDDLTPAEPQLWQNEKPAATKISGKEILEAIRLMDADERRELARALFA